MTGERTPSFLDLLRYREGAGASDALRAALATPGGESARRLALVDELLGLLGEARAEPVPEGLRRAVRAIPARARRRSILRELVARLVPRAGGDAVPAFRGAAAAAPRLYAAGPWEVDLTRLPGGAVVGQVLPADPDAPEPALEDALALLCGEGRVLEGELEPGGSFRFPAVEPGRYLLLLELEGDRVVVPDLDLGAPG